MRIAAALFLLAIFAMAAAAQAPTPATSLVVTPGISLTIRAVNEVFKIGSPVDIDITLKNDSGHDFKIADVGDGRALCNYRVAVRDEKGNIPPETHFGIMQNGNIDASNWEHSGLSVGEMISHCIGHIVLTSDFRSGDSRHDLLDVRGSYNLAVPGRYSIQIIKHDGGIYAKSNTISVTINP
jgi:hypothetical protein